MILHRVRIEGYQALRNPIELSGLGVGLHVIHGPNETGKSTLIAAIARAFFDRYNTTDQDLRATQPWGTELAPRVTLEFETQGKRFRLEKRFLDEESSALSEWTGSRFERVADSVKSDDQVREMLSATAARAGTADLKN
jgi:DNA repair exonuclease SbcCD ATPase subunit